MSESTNGPREPREPNPLQHGEEGGYPSRPDDNRQSWAQDAYWSRSNDSWTNQGNPSTTQPPPWEASEQPAPSAGGKNPDPAKG